MFPTPANSSRQDWDRDYSPAPWSPAGCPPSALELELTETVVMKNCDERAAERFGAAARPLGNSAPAIDDFGNPDILRSNSSRTFPIDYSEDRFNPLLRNPRSSFSQRENRGMARLLRAPIRPPWRQQLGLRVVAEGVEKPMTNLSCFAALGCDPGAGILIPKPMRVGSLRSVLARSPIPLRFRRGENRKSLSRVGLASRINQTSRFSQETWDDFGERFRKITGKTAGQRFEVEFLIVGGLRGHEVWRAAKYERPSECGCTFPPPNSARVIGALRKFWRSPRA